MLTVFYWIRRSSTAPETLICFPVSPVGSWQFVWMRFIIWIYLLAVIVIAFTIRATMRPPIHTFFTDTFFAPKLQSGRFFQIFLNAYLSRNNLFFHISYTIIRICPLSSCPIRKFFVRSHTHNSGRFARTKAAGIGGQTALPQRRTCSDRLYSFPSKSRSMI